MKSRKCFGRQVRISLSVAAAMCGIVGVRQSAEAADFVWTNGGGTSTWDNPLNWNIGSGFPNSTADTASFGAGAIGVVDLNGDRKVGSLSFGGSPGGIALGVSANTLTLDNGAGGGTLNESGGRIDTIGTRLLATGLVGNVTGGDLILANVADGAGANSLAGTFTIGSGGTLEGHFTGTSNSLGAASITLAGGNLTLANSGAAGVTASLENNVLVTGDSSLAVGGPAASNSLGTLALTSGKTLTVGSGANIAMVSTAFAPPAPDLLDPGRTFTFNVALGSTLSLGQFSDSNGPLNGDVLTKNGDGKLIFGPITPNPVMATLSIAQGEAVLQSAAGKAPFSGSVRLNGANTRLTYEVQSGSISTLSRITVSDDATIAQVVTAPVDGQPHGVTLSGNIPVSVAGKTLTFDVGGDVMQVNGFISGTNITLAKVGSGTLNLNAANTYSGTTTIAPGGFLRLSNAKALGSSSLSLGAGQMLDVNASLTGTGTITIAPGAILRLGGVTPSLGGTQLTPASIPAGTLIQLKSGGSGDALEQVNPAVFYTILSSGVGLGNPINLSHDPNFPLSGIFTNSDADAFVSGASTSINAGNGVVLASTTGRKLQLTGTVNAGTNVLTIGSVLPIDGLAKNGTVQANVTAAEIDVVSGTFFGAVTNDAPIVVRPGGTAIFNGGNSTYFLEGGNGLATFNGGSGGLAGNGNVTIGLGSTGSVVTPIIGSNNLNTRFSGVIGQDTGTNLAGIQKFGTGLLELTGQSTFLGVTNITKGTVLVSGSGRISLGDVSVGNASLRIESLGAIAPGKKVGGLLGLDAMIDPTSIVGGSVGNVVAINVDNYTIPLNQSLIGNGMVSLGSQLPATVTVLTGETTTSTATVQLPGNGTYGATSLGAGKTITPAVSAGEYWLGGGGGRLTVLNGVLVGDNEVAIQGIVSLLSPNSYTKVTAINGLLLANNGNNGSATGSGPISIGGGGILGGNGTVLTDSARFIDVGFGGAISPGDGGPGTLNIRSTNATPGSSFNSTVWFEGTAALIVDVNPKGSSDLINLVGTLELGTAQLSATLLSAPTFGDVIPLLKNDGADVIGGAFSGLPEGAILELPFGGGTYDFRISYKANLDGGSVGNDIALTAVPEAGTLGGIVTAATFFLSGRRRKLSRG